MRQSDSLTQEQKAQVFKRLFKTEFTLRIRTLERSRAEKLHGRWFASPGNYHWFLMDGDNCRAEDKADGLRRVRNEATMIAKSLGGKITKEVRE